MRKEIFSRFSISNFYHFFETIVKNIFLPPKTRFGGKTHEIWILKNWPITKWQTIYWTMSYHSPYPWIFSVKSKVNFFPYVKIINLIKRSLKKRMILQLHSTNLTYCSCIPLIECFEKNLIFVEESVPLPYRITSKEKCYYFCEMVPTCMVSDYHSCKSCKRFSCDFFF